MGRRKKAGARDDWATDPRWVQTMADAFGVRIVGDVCATRLNAKAPAFLGDGDDALAPEWWSRRLPVPRPGEAWWMNPPFSEASDFLARAVQETDRASCVLLGVMQQSSARYMWDTIYRRAAYLVLPFAAGQPKASARLQYVAPPGREASTADFDSVGFVLTGAAASYGPPELVYLPRPGTETRYHVVRADARPPFEPTFESDALGDAFARVRPPSARFMVVDSIRELVMARMNRPLY